MKTKVQQNGDGVSCIPLDCREDRSTQIFSFIAYMFLALIYKEIEKRYESVSPILISTIGCLNDINLIYAAKGKRITKKLECKSRTSEVITKGLKPESMIRD